MADDALIASDGIAGAGGWRKGCVGAAPREQGQVIRVTPGPRLSPWSGEYACGADGSKVPVM